MSSCPAATTGETFSTAISNSLVAASSSLAAAVGLLGGSLAVDVSQYISPSRPEVSDYRTADTWQSAMVNTGSVTSLLSNAAVVAVGAAGLERLTGFAQLQAGWDGRRSNPLDLDSVAVFSRFFDETRLYRDRMGTYMSAQGNVVINWLDSAGGLIELEFSPSGVDYFFESSGLEGAVVIGCQRQSNFDPFRA